MTLSSRTYTNPVYPEYFADPFVVRHEREYFAIGTGMREAKGEGPEGEQGLVFPMLRSHDLVTWRASHNALVRPDVSLGDTFWAPEIAFEGGLFYLYYSVGREDKGHQLRVATSDRPEGPYRDTGRPLIDPAECPFAIDPHVFRDVDGRWYLFYARDFLDLSRDARGPVRAGTALMVAPMASMTALEGPGTLVLRARSDWQRFEANRAMYGDVYDWHTLEGPCVRMHEGRYYCFYSGGRWENDTYGVDYGVADSALGPYSDAGNEAGPRVLRSAPGGALGPGHNSIVLGPDDATEYVVYHAWSADMSARRMCIDPLVWGPEGPHCAGPSAGQRTIFIR